ILGVVAVIAVRTHGFGLVDTAEREAQDRCETDVRGKLVTPASSASPVGKPLPTRAGPSRS
ncbi:hypothetical protein, partial [Streptomyces asiaticus]|uniref:hypothetical protein n=1 Tax=Streptomyces asiaticus TaxID=114695 RepID=UPI003F67EF5A